jgi:fatty-acid desaturase
MASRSDLGALLAFFFVDLGAILAAAILYCVAGILGIGMGYHRSEPR